ncbi:MAG: hypothetical protein WBO19_12450 [Terriglobia bacterium]|jgi:hypothetical protein
MAPSNKKEKGIGSRLDVARVMEDFQKSEESSSHRNGTFKIDVPFEEALKTIVKAKPEPKKPTSRKG